MKKQPDISVIIRTYNEERHIAELIRAIHAQAFEGKVEIIVVDSGSTDNTVALARAFANVSITFIAKELFSYGYALNQGLRRARGKIAVSISAHCLPVDKYWLRDLVAPLSDESVAIAYGRQIGTPTSRLSEKRIFEKTFPHTTRQDSTTIYNHNGNSAFRLADWRECPFNETLQGLEDLDYALKMAQNGLRCVYVPQATVLHYHLETNDKVFNRYYRETLSLKAIRHLKPVSKSALIFDGLKALLGDYWQACKEARIRKVFFGVLGYRLSQYCAIYTAHYGLSNKSITSRVQSWLLKKLSHSTGNVIPLRPEGVQRIPSEQPVLSRLAANFRSLL